MSNLTRPRRIIVGVRDSINSVAALRRAYVEISEPDTEICLVHVIAKDSSSHQAEAAERGMSDLVGRHTLSGVKEVAKVQIEHGEPGPVLARMSADADLLIIGACDNSENRGIFSGEVVSFCLSNSSCPVRVCANHSQANGASSDSSPARNLMK